MAAGVPGVDDDLESGATAVPTRRRRGDRTRRHDQPALATATVKHRPAPPTGRQVEPQCLSDEAAPWPSLKTPPLPAIDLERRRTAAPGPRVPEHPPAALARRLEPGLGIADFLSRLPGGRGASELRAAADAIARARLGGHGVVLGVGALAFELGLSPLIVDLMERGVVTAVALDGGALLHDFTIALDGGSVASSGSRSARGRSSSPRDGRAVLARVVREAAAIAEGLGAAVGRHVAASRYAQRTLSVAAAGARLGVPVTVHVAIGSGIGQPSAAGEGAAVGAASLRDFESLTAVVAGLREGVYLGVGSSTVLAEVVAEAIDLARSLGHAVRPRTTIDLAATAGAVAAAADPRVLSLAGHPDLLFPLLTVAVLERLAVARNASRPRRR